jgi:hypothetical protein
MASRLVAMGETPFQSLTTRSHPVSDVIFIAVMIVFFVLCALYVQLCDRMIGPDESALAARDDDSAVDSEAPTLVTAIAGASDGVTA